MTANSFGSRAALNVAGHQYEIYRLDAAEGSGSLPYSLKVLLENLLRNEDGANITADHIRALAQWDPSQEPDTEIQFTPARVILQDFTGVPAVVDLAAMREAMRALGGDAAKINPLVPAELVIDHSVVADVFGSPDAFDQERGDRVRAQPGALRVPALGPEGVQPVQGRAARHRHRAPGQHRVPGPGGDEPRRTRPIPTPAWAPTRTPPWSTASACSAGASAASRPRPAMLGQPISMLIPKVVGFRLTGELPSGATATDLVLTITELLRKHGVVGKFVEFYGDGVAAVPVANRATIGNMSPEFGSTCAIFPIDHETLDYLTLTGRPARAARPGRGLRQGAGPLARPGPRDCATPRSSARPVHRGARRSPARSARRTGSRWPTPRPPSARRCPTTCRRPTGQRPGRHLPGLGPGRGRRRDAGLEPDPGHPGRRHDDQRRPRRGGDRRDHLAAPTPPTRRSWSAPRCWPRRPWSGA